MTSFSQGGEDLHIASLFPPGFIGSIIEVGACSPISLSNSRLFIEAGFDAYLIEPSPGPLRALLQEYGYNPKVRIFAGAVGTGFQWVSRRFEISDGPLSTDDPAVRAQWKDDTFIGHLEVPIYPAAFFGLFPCDILSVDTEGNSMDVAIAMLEHRHELPRVVCVEREPKDGQKIANICQRFGYKLAHHEPSNGINKIFVKV